MGTWYMSLYLVLLVILFRCILGNNSPVLNVSYFHPPLPIRPPSPPPPSPFELLSKGLCDNISQSSTNVENLYVPFICFNISDRSVYEPWNFKDKIFNRTVVIYINHCFTAHGFVSDRTCRNEMEYNELSSLELSTNHYFSSVISSGLINNCPSSGAEIPTNQNPSKDEKGKKQIVILSVLLPLLLLVPLLLFFLFFVLRKRSNLHLSNGGQYSSLGPYSFQTPSMTWDVDIKLPISVPVIIIDKPLLDLTFADLLSATNQFDQSTLLSEGRSGLVYCGELRGGFHVAIKVLVQESFLSDQELASELERLGRIKHPNLVPLIGYCFAGLQRMVIFEYMENGNLNNLLHDFNSTETASEAVVIEQEWNVNGENYESYNGEINTWSFRHRLAVGIARGLAFLHHACSPQIVHGYVKASSICLDSEFKPRFSDYGLSKITIKPEDENTFGSPGYLSPDLSSGSPPCFSTAQSDVYGFGIVLFEIVTGKKPRDDEYPGEKCGNLVDWVRGLVIKGELFKAIDSSIRQTGSVRRMEEALKIGYLCTSGTSSKRPTMQQVLGLLKDIEPECFDK